MSNFSHRDIFAKRMAAKSTIFGWVEPDVTIHTRTCLDLSRICLESLWDIARYI